jgi:hypothetical protein
VLDSPFRDPHSHLAKRQEAAALIVVAVVRVAVGAVWTVVFVCLITGRTIPLVHVRAAPSLLTIGAWMLFGGPVLFFVGRLLALGITLPINAFIGARGNRKIGAGTYFGS